MSDHTTINLKEDDVIIDVPLESNSIDKNTTSVDTTIENLPPLYRNESSVFGPTVQTVPSNLDNISAKLIMEIIEAIEKKTVDVNNLPTFIFHIMNLVQNVENLSGLEKKQVVLKVLEVVANKYSVIVDWQLVSNMIDFSVSLANQEVSLGTNEVKKGCWACLKVLFSKKK